MSTCPNCQKNKKQPRDEELVKKIKTRLNKISGQVNGVSKMIEENRYCVDVLTQISAIESALREIGFIVLEDHLKSCVANDIKTDDFSSLEEAVAMCKKLI